MAELTTSYLGAGRAYSTEANTFDVRFGGQNGYAPNINQWLNAQPMVSNDLVVLLYRAPKMFTLFNETDRKLWIGALRAMIEQHADSITGFNATLEVALADKKIGGTAEIFQRHTKVTKARSDITMEFTDLEGEPFQRILDIWIKYGIRDPETGFPLASTFDSNIKEWGADWYTMDILAFEPDNLFKSVRKAWLLTNMHPTTSGEVIGSRNLGEEKGLKTMSIPFTSWGVSNEGVKRLAVKHMESISLLHADSINSNAFTDGPTASVAATDQESGYEHGVDLLAKNRPAGNAGSLV